jgi:hypothetical protein
MRTAIFLLVLSLAAPVRSQDESPTAAPESAGSDDSGVSHVADYAAPMSLDDARMNFGTVIDAFLAEKTQKGYWPLREKLTGKILHLQLVSKDPKTVADAGAGGKFTGTVNFVDLLTREKRKTEFTVDLSGSQWKVVSMHLFPGPRKKKAGGSSAPPNQPEGTSPAPSAPQAAQPPQTGGPVGGSGPVNAPGGAPQKQP